MVRNKLGVSPELLSDEVILAALVECVWSVDLAAAYLRQAVTKG